jgi:hypothetical protein
MKLLDLYSKDACPICGQTPCNCTFVAEEKVRLDPRCWTGKKIGNPKTKVKGGVRVNNCVPAEGVAKGTLNELEYDSGMGNDPTAYYAALITLSKTIRKDQAHFASDDEADEIKAVARAFFKQGMAAGRQAFMQADTRELMTDYLDDRGFDVQADLFKPYRDELAAMQADAAVKRAQWQSSPQYKKIKDAEVKISAIPDKPINSWSKPGEPATFVSFDNHPGRDIKAEFAAFRKQVEQSPSLQGVPLKFEITIGGQPVDPASLSEQGVAEADKHSMLGKIQRHQELKKKVDTSFADIGKAQKAGDHSTASKAFRKHERYANLERPGTWTKSKEQGVAEGSAFDKWADERVASQLHKLIAPEIKGKIQNIVSRLSDEYGMWDHKAQTFTPDGLEHLKSILKFNDKYIKYALSLTSRDFEAEGVAEGLSKRDQKDVDAIKAAIERLQAQLKQPNADRDAIQQSIAHEKKRLALYGQGVAEGPDEKIGGRYDADDFDAMVSRLKKLAGSGPMKTVWDPQRRVYKNVPTAQQPKQQPQK